MKSISRLSIGFLCLSLSTVEVVSSQASKQPPIPASSGSLAQAKNGASTSDEAPFGLEQQTAKTTLPPPPPTEPLTNNAIAPPPVPSKTDWMVNRRPSVDIGLRYSSNDWWINLLTTPNSYILRRIRFHLFSNILGCIAILFCHERKIANLSIPMTGHSLLASSLGLLLSYRTNSAYARFWAARGHWTDTKATCRNLAVSIKAHMEPHAPKSAKKFLDQLAAFPATLMHLCLGGAAQLPLHAEKLLPKESEPTNYQERPAWPAMLLCLEMQKTLLEAEHESKYAKYNFIEAAHFAHFSHSVDVLIKHMSSCEKILRTPVPWSYSRHTSRFLSLWIGTLPLALLDSVNRWLVLPIVIAVGYCLLGIEEIGHLIEQPFVGDPIRDPLNGGQRIYVSLDEDGEASEIIKRGRKTMPYDIGIPVCSLANQIRKEVEKIAKMDYGSSKH